MQSYMGINIIYLLIFCFLKNQPSLEHMHPLEAVLLSPKVVLLQPQLVIVTEPCQILKKEELEDINNAIQTCDSMNFYKFSGICKPNIFIKAHKSLNFYAQAYTGTH